MMSMHWTCWLGTVVGAGFLGWGIKGLMVGTVIDDKRREVERLASKVTMLTKLANQPPEVRTVEKRIEVPVERVVVKRVEVPVEKIIEKLVEVPIEKTVEKIVDRPVDNPEHLARIKALEGEVAVIVRLLGQIAQLQTVSAQAGGRASEGRVVVPVDDPEQLTRIKALEGEVAVIDDLRVQIAELQAASAQTGEKIVEKRIAPHIESHGKVPVDNSEQLARIKALEGEVAVIDDLRAQIAQLQAASAQAGEMVFRTQVEYYKKYKKWLGEGEPPREGLDLPTQLTQLQATSSQIGEKTVEGQIERSAGQTVVQSREAPVVTSSEPAGELDHAGEPSDEGPAVGASPDDLKHIRGVGPALERFLHKRGVFSFRQVATWSQADIDKFEFLLPNFGGRIQRENWVRSAQLEHYRKYAQWLGEGEPPRESLDLPEQIEKFQSLSSQAGEPVVEEEIETSAASNEEMRIDRANGPSEEEQTSKELPDDLKLIRGVGPALERFLHKRGVFWFSQVATWSQADIDKFEFLLPNFGGRIQRENWVRSAQLEHYRKYTQWLGEGEPPHESPDVHAQIVETQAVSSRVDQKVDKMRIEAHAEQIVVKNGDIPVEMTSDSVGDLDYAEAVAQLDEGLSGPESPDDLKHIRGVGPALERFLHKRGVFWFSQVATWSQKDIDKFEFLLPNFGGRIQRENWVRSAQLEHYRKYKQWLGNDEPTMTTPETPSV